MTISPGRSTLAKLSKRLTVLTERYKRATMAKVLSILELLLLAVCLQGFAAAPAPSLSVGLLKAEAWSILYSPGMPPHPTPRKGGGWYFNFPTDPNSVHYVLAAVNMAASSFVDAGILVTTTGRP